MRLFSSSASISVMQVSSACQGLFIDLNDTLYCSIYNHQVVEKHLNDTEFDSKLIETISDEL
jgi:hypothetical protein